MEFNDELKQGILNDVAKSLGKEIMSEVNLQKDKLDIDTKTNALIVPDSYPAELIQKIRLRLEDK